MGIPLDDLLNDEAPSPKPKKKPRWLKGWNRLGCLALFQTLAIAVLISLLLIEFQASSTRTIIVRMDPSPLPPGVQIYGVGSLSLSSPTPLQSADTPPILAAEPPIITVDNVDAVRELTRFDDVEHIAWSTAGRTLVICDGPNFRWYDLYQHAPLSAELKLDVNVGWPFAVSPDRRYLATANHNGQLTVWDIDDQHSRLRVGAFSGPLRSVAYSHYGEFLAVGGQQGGLRVWSLSKSTIQWEALPAAGDERFMVEGVDFSPNDRWLVSAGMRGNVTIWDTETGAEVFVIETDQSPQDVVFGPDGRTIAYAVDNSVFVWDTETQQALYQLDGHASWVLRVSFSPNGRLLASSGNDGNIILWDMQSGEKLRVLFDERLPIAVGDMAFSPDGRLIAAVYAEEGFHPLVLWGIPNE